MEVDKGLLMEGARKQVLMSTLLESLEQCPEDLLDGEPHPDDKILVTFADLVYTKKNSGELDAAYEDRLHKISSGKLDGWKLLITATNKDRLNGYFGAAFAHTSLQQVVVTHRGTDPSCFGALYTDVLGVFGTKYTSCMNSAMTFVEYIRQAIQSANDQRRHYTLAITGHSLGAWLAQITTFSVKYLAINQDHLEKNQDVGIHAKTVGFDSPGARNMLDRVLDDHYDRYAMNVFLDGLDITLYLSAPNRINTCGVHLGKIYHVFIDFTTFNWLDKNTFTNTLATHAMRNFVDAFEDEDRKIGEVLDWAKSAEEYDKLFEKRDDVYKFEDEYLLEKLYRHNVVEPKSVTCSFRVFSKDELRILYMFYELQEQKSDQVIINDFIKKNLKVEITKLLPDFEMDHYNRTITGKSGQSLVALCKRLKQLMRWKPQFTQAVEDQIKVFPRAAEFICYTEGQSYLDSLPRCCLDFVDCVDFQKFLLSGDERVLCIVSQSGEGVFQITRLRNILHQIQRSVDTTLDQSVKQYTAERHYTFMDWPQLKSLAQIYKLPVDKEYMMVVDSTSASFTMEDREMLINHVRSHAMKLVLIALQPIVTPDSTKFIKTVIPKYNIELEDLTPNSRRILLDRDNVIVSGDEAYSFRKFLGKDSSDDDINQILASESLKNFAVIENYAINIKGTRPTIAELQMPYFKLHIKTNMAFILSYVGSPDTSILVVSGLSREELETGADWDQIKGKIILADGDAELAFKDTCNKNRDKIVYLLDISGEDIYCKHIFNEGFYLPRKFFHRVRIDVRIFAKFNNDLFVMCSEEEKTLLSGLIDNLTHREEFLKNVRIADTKGEEDIIQKFNNKNIHFLRIDQSEDRHKLEWRYSHGSINELRRFASTDCFESISELNVSQTEHNLVIIADEPGMGKTTSLAILSRHVTSPFIIHIKINQFKEHIARIPSVLNVQNVARFLLSECCAHASGSPVHKLLEHFLKSATQSKQIILFFDGFDELDDYVEVKDRAVENIIRLLIFLKNKPTVQIFLTVRKYLKESLESELSQFSTCFEEVIEEEQLRFLVQFWQSCLPLELEGSGEEQKGRLKVYAEELLREAKGVLRTDMGSFMGVPLQLRMLSEVFRPWRNPSVQPQELLFKQFDINSAPKLYKRFITLKYDIFLYDKTLLGPKMDKLLEEEILDYINTTHGKLGFKNFFNSFFNNFFKDVPENLLNALNRQGLLESKRNGEFQFVHRTYAEYFCAQAVVRWLKKRGGHYKYPLVKEILLPGILLLPNNKIIRLFMNGTLQETEMGDPVQRENAEHISQLLLDGSSVPQNAKRETALHIAVQERNEHIIKFLLCRLNTVSVSGQEAFISFITHSDTNHQTALNVVDGFLSNQYIGTFFRKDVRPNYAYYVTDIPLKPMQDVTVETEERKVFDRIMETVFRSIEACSEELKKKVVLASLLNRDMSKSQISKYLQGSDDNARLLERATKVLSEVRERLFKAIRNEDLNQIKALFDQLSPTELQHVFLVKDVMRTNPDYPTILHWAAHCGHLRVVKLLHNTTLVPFIELMAEGDNQFRTPLSIAAGRGALDVVRYFVENGADVNVRNVKGKSALMCAAEGGHHSTMKYLLAHEADISALDQGGHFVLLMVAELGNLPLVKYLIEHDADVNCVDNSGQSALHVAAVCGHLPVVEYLAEHGATIDHLCKVHLSALQKAGLMGHLPIVRYLVERGAAVNSLSAVDTPLPSTSKTNPSYTALQLAAKNGQLPVVEYLMLHGALINSVDFLGRTALYMAAEEGHLQTVQYLVQNSADVNILDNKGISALSRAAEEGHLSIVQLLVQHVTNINAVDRDGLSALHKVAKNGYLTIVQHLIEHNAIINTLDDGVSALHNAADEGHLAVVQLLIQNNANVNAVDKDGLSPLHRAAQEGHYRTVEHLVENDADVKSIGKDGLSALYRASKNNHFRIVDFLIRHGAELNSGHNTMDILDLADVECNANDEEVLSELHIAAYRGHLPTVDYLITQCGFDIESKDAIGQTALHKAAEVGIVPVIQFLVEHGADYDCADCNGLTVLQQATYEGNFKAVKYLLRHGADVDKKNNIGDTALCIASEHSQWKILQLLVEKGADVNVKDGIALSWPIESGEWTIVEYLVDKGVSVCEGLVKENLALFKQLHPGYVFKKHVVNAGTVDTAI